MAQININVTPQFEKHLKVLMRSWNIRTKSDVIRMALAQAVERLRGRRHHVNFTHWVGLASKYAQNPAPRFKSEDDLWESNDGD